MGPVLPQNAHRAIPNPVHAPVNEQVKRDDRPRARSRPPKLPPGATFTPTQQHAITDDGKEVIRSRSVLSRDRHYKKQLLDSGLSPRQLKRLKKRLNRGEA